ncbi:hypothetical protein [Ruminococcus flavefaciens]|uniref:hypothetical protein n=1 Tax=Ruminococcus flavefaciens TaxID=1265 RepID=UPI00031D9C2F|nr:hypothetical protein [Ruminococcus flavefaciens]
MRRGTIFVTMAVLSIAFSGCAGKTKADVRPLLGLKWFASCDDVKASLGSYKLLDERENKDSGNSVHQTMLDYSDVRLYETDCDLTLCFTDSGLIGLNYHDMDKQKSYKEWFGTLETRYGLPTEEGSGMASWYGNPLGKDTAIYLFNLQEGVQVSFYATADSPDKSYERAVPAPEIRTPVIPVSDNSEEPVSEKASETENAEVASSGGEMLRSNLREGDIVSQNIIGTDSVGNMSIVVTDTAGEAVTDAVGETVTTVVTAVTSDAVTDKNVSSAASGTTAAAVTASVTVNKTTEPATSAPRTDKKNAFLINGLTFYGSPETELKKLKRYSKTYEYRTEEPGQPWELVMEYENVTYLGRKCNSVLCFTSLGLVGINFFDSRKTDFDYWRRTLTDIYGTPDEVQYDYISWSGAVGEGTMVYVFALDDGVQISFFTDDTGSEIV